MPVHSRHCRCCRLACVLALTLGVLSPPVQAQDAGGEDPGVVVTRTVQPRIAYRGIPTQDNPIHARATTFPAQVFHGTMDDVLGRLAGEELLGQHGSAGLAGDVGRALTGAGPAGTSAAPAAVFGPAAQGALGRVPIGPGATVGGATAGIGERIGGSVLRVLAPAATPGGGP